MKNFRKLYKKKLQVLIFQMTTSVWHIQLTCYLPIKITGPPVNIRTLMRSIKTQKDLTYFNSLHFDF